MEKISTLVEGGKATAGPPLGPKLGPLGVNIGEIVNTINNKTEDMEGIDVPVTIRVDPETKEFEVEVGKPSVASLVKKELGLESGAGNQTLPVADMSIDRAIKIAKLKIDDLLSFKVKNAVKDVLGTCVSMGIKVEGKDPREVQKEIDNGKYQDKIESKKELSFWDEEKIEEKKEELKEIIEEKKEEERLAEEAEEAEELEVEVEEKEEIVEEGEKPKKEETKEIKEKEGEEK